MRIDICLARISPRVCSSNVELSDQDVFDSRILVYPESSYLKIRSVRDSGHHSSKTSGKKDLIDTIN